MVVQEPAALADVLAQRVVSAGQRALDARGSFSIALPGGSVAAAFFPRLAAAAFDWRQAHFFWVDERAVPPSDPESNYGAARALWLAPAGVPDARLHRMRGEAADLDGEARAYEAGLRRALGDPPVLDVALLGVGPDGHVASLFPGHRLLEETARRAAALDDAPKPPPRRLTLTLPALSAARLVVVAAFGAGKADVVRQALEAPASPLPLARLARAAGAALFLLDAEAAGALRR